MRRIALEFILGMLIACMLTSHARAAEGPPRREAIVIGNWDYNENGQFDDIHQTPYASDLQSPCADAQAVAAALKSQNFRVHQACNIGREQWKTRFEEFERVTSDLPAGSVVFIYFSGHGIQHNGYAFTVPVGFQLDVTSWGTKPEVAKVEDLRRRANDLTRELNQLNSNPDVAVVIAIDACRDSPVGDSNAYNQRVSVLVPANAIVQYATTPGDRLPDTSSKLSDYADALAQQIRKGGDIGDAMGQVQARLWRSFRDDARTTYVDSNIGPAFAALRYTAVEGTIDQAQTSVRPTIAKPLGALPPKELIRKTEDGVRLDVLWCAGENEVEHYNNAHSFATDVAARAKELGVGRIQTKILRPDVNPKGYNVRRNLMRYDNIDPKERSLLIRLASEFRRFSFLPQQGLGVGGQPTWNYVSAFVCGRVATE